MDFLTPNPEVLDDAVHTQTDDLKCSLSSVAAPNLCAIRQATINLNHWYVVARCCELTDHPLGVVIGGQAIVLFRGRHGQISALEDRCPHRQVRLSQGEVEGDQIVCIYHGWQFDGAGACVEVPYLNTKQRLPNCRLLSYPVQEQDGFIWVYPGDRSVLEHQNIQPLALPEWNHLNYIATVSIIDVKAHFSFVIENLMDMYHGRLHDSLQAWANPVLESVSVANNRVDAYYAAETYYKIDKIWSIAQLFIPALRKLRPTRLDVSYVYPHWQASLGKDFKLYCLFCPVDETHTKAYLVHFVSLNAFENLHKTPRWLRRLIKNRLFNAARGMLDALVKQDVLMMEDEQRAFSMEPWRKGPEFNPVITKVQRLIEAQHHS